MITEMRHDGRPEVGKVFADPCNMAVTYRIEEVLGHERVRAGEDRHGACIKVSVWEVRQTRVVMNWDTREWEEVK